MAHAIVFDCEFLTADGAPSRFWCGPHDPDPVVAQIGCARLSLEGGFEINQTQRTYVIPTGRDGGRVALDPLFIRLTGITEEEIDAQGVPLEQALAQTAAFADGARLWSWGKDEFNMMAISCYVAGLTPPLPISRFGNACALLLKAGMPFEDLAKTRSNTLADYYKVSHPPLRGHDALDDALSVAYVLQHLLKEGALRADDFA
ncbi:MAG: exonuclease [Pseudomonadota bacterium]